MTPRIPITQNRVEMAVTTPWSHVGRNTNTFRGLDETDETSFCPVGRHKSTHLPLSSKQENTDDYGRWVGKT